MPTMGELARQDDLGGFTDTVDPDLARYSPDDTASNMSIQPPYQRSEAPPDARWLMGALAAQDAYRPRPELPDVGPPAIGSGGQFSAGVPAVNRAADVLSRYPGHVMGGLLGLPQQAFGASEEMRQGGTYDPAPAVQTALMTMGTGAIAGAPVQGAEAVLGAGPIRAYHSSPHDFEKFDLRKIGTGEGAQMYGHGMYFAENPAVSGQGGQYWNQFRGRFDIPERNAALTLSLNKFDREAAIAETQAKLVDPRMHHSPASLARAQKELELLQSGTPVGPRTYEVNINAEPSHFLDWEKTLEKQPEIWERIPTSTRGKIDATYNKRGWSTPSEAPDAFTGQDIYRALTNFDKKSPAKVSALLNETAGIAGIKYLDGLSRNARQILAPRTNNYVVFNPNILDIMKKYGLVGAAPAGLGALAAQDNYQPEEKM